MPGFDASEDALSLITLRTVIATGLVRRGAPDNAARCYAGKMVQAFSWPQLSTPRLLQTHPKALAKARRIGASCR